MNRLKLLFLFCGISVFGYSQEYQFQYTMKAGTNVADIESDTFGNIYTVGRGNILPSCVDTSAISYRGSAYIAKYDPIGNVIWRLNFGGSDAQAEGLDIDPDGNLIVVGFFSGIGDFSSTPEPSFGMTADRQDLFVMKVAPAGEIIWIKRAGGQSDDQAFDVDTDANGNIYVTGTFNFWVDFGHIELKGTNFNHDPFIWALRPNGFTKWVKQIPSGIMSEGRKIVVDADGNITNTGEIYEIGNRNAERFTYIAKYSPDGDSIFMKTILTDNKSKNRGLTCDAKSNIFLTGALSGSNGHSVDFDPGPDEYILSGSAPLWLDAFLLKLNKNGEFLWVQQTGDDRGSCASSDIEFGENGNIFVAGNFRNKVDFDTGEGTFEFTTHPQGGTTYLQVLDSTGNFITALHGQGISGSQGFGTQSMTLNQNGQIFLGRMVFPGFYQAHIDVFGECATTFQSEPITVCLPYEINEIPVTSDCNFRILQPDSTGCGSIKETAIKVISNLHTQFGITDTTLESGYEMGDIVWLDCDEDFEPIPDTEGHYIFQPNQSGNYAYVISMNGCRDTSGCFPFELPMSNITESPFSKTEIFPNPFFNEINLKNLPLAFAEISIFDLSGKLVVAMEKPDGVANFSISTNDFSKGVFFLYLK